MSEGGSSKEIKFSFVVDQASAQSVMRTLKDLTDQAEKFAKALQGAAGSLGGGGGMMNGVVGGKARGPASTVVSAAGKGRGGGGSAITNVVMENAKAFKSMATMSGDALKSMQDILKKSVDDQKRSIGDLDKTIDALGKKYQQLKKDQQDALSGGNKLVAHQLGNRMSKTGEDLASAQSAKVKLAAEKAAGEAHLPKPGLWGRLQQGWSQGGIGGVMNTNMGNMPGGGMLQQGMSAMGMGGLSRLAGPLALLALGKTALDETRTNSRQMTDAMADRGRTVNPTIRELRTGDTSFLAKQRFLSQDSTLKKELEDQFKGAGAKVEAFKDSSGSLFDKVARAVTSGAQTITGAETLDPKLQTQLMKQYMDQIAKVGDMTEYQQGYGRFAEYQSATSASRMQMAHSGGPKRGFENFKDAKGRDIGSGRMVDRYLDRQIALAKDGFTAEEEHAAEMGVFAQTGVRGYGNQMMRAQAGGYGAYGGVLAQSLHQTGTDAAARMSVGGNVNKMAGMQFGQGVMGFNQYGLQDQSAIFAAAQNSGAFTGGAMDFSAGTRMMAGLQAGNAAYGTGDGYQQGNNLLGAINILGKDGNYRSQDHLAGMSLTDLMGSKLTEQEKRLGITQEHKKKMLDAKLQAGLDENIDVGGNDRMSVAMRKYRASGSKSVTDYISKKGEQESKDLLAGLGVSKNMDEGQMEGFSDMVYGFSKGGKAKKGGVGAGKLGAVEQAEADAKVEQLKKEKQLSEQFAAIKMAELKSAEAAAKNLETAGTNLSKEVDQLAANFDTLNQAVQGAAQNMSKLMSPEDRAKFTKSLAENPNSRKAGPTSSKAGPMSSEPNQSVAPPNSSR